MKTGLTKRQARVLTAIGVLQKRLDPDVGATVRECCEEAGVKSTSNMHRILIGLALRGRAIYEPGRKRSIRLVETGTLTITLPSDLDAKMRDIAQRAGITPEQAVIEAVRDACSQMLSLVASKFCESVGVAHDCAAVRKAESKSSDLEA